MISSLRAAIPTSGVSPIPKDIFLLEEIKSLVEDLIAQTDIAKRFKPRLYNYVDFIFPVIYALSTSLSIEQACKELNNFFISHLKQLYDLEPITFIDGIRKRRLVPHQTKVDLFLNRLYEKEVQFIFGNLLNRINEVIRKREIFGTKVKFIADNTKYPYYGDKRTITEIGATGLQGTRFCRMFQGHSIYGCGLHLFTHFNIIRKGDYRSKEIPVEVSWLKWLGYNISYALVDREFYRVTLIRALRKIGVPIIVPAKKFMRVKKEMRNFIRKKRDLIENYLFSQSSKQYPNQSSVKVFLVFIGHKNKTADEVRNRYYKNNKPMDKCISEMAGFFTTIRPWNNVRAFIRFLTRTYKQRWNIETGFRELNKTHYSFRNRESVKQLTQIYLKALIYNNWQFWRKRTLKESISFSDGAQQLFLRKLSHAVIETYWTIIEDRINYALKNKKMVNFK